MKKSFVFGFRQGNKTLSEAEQKRRTEGFRGCALQRQHGRNFEPRILGAESEQLGDRQDSVTDERPVIASISSRQGISTKPYKSRRPIPAFKRLPKSAHMIGDHRLRLFAGERMREFRHIVNHPVNAVFR